MGVPFSLLQLAIDPSTQAQGYEIACALEPQEPGTLHVYLEATRYRAKSPIYPVGVARRPRKGWHVYYDHRGKFNEKFPVCSDGVGQGETLREAWLAIALERAKKPWCVYFPSTFGRVLWWHTSFASSEPSAWVSFLNEYRGAGVDHPPQGGVSRYMAPSRALVESIKGCSDDA